MKRETKIINLLAGPGAGKTTSAWTIAAELKKLGKVVEYVPEYAKELVWEERFDDLDGSYEKQLQVYEEQKHRLDRLIGKVDYIVIDSPLILQNIYVDKEMNSEEKYLNFTEMVRRDFSQYDNINLFVERHSGFESEGRIHDEDRSRDIDDKILEYLQNNEIEYTLLSDSNIEAVINDISGKTNEPIKALEELPVVNIRLVDAPSLKPKRGRIENSNDAARVIAAELKQFDREAFGILNLNAKREVINFNISSIGGLSSALIDPRQTFKSAILSNAAAVMLFHNHPSGDYTPSQDDIATTERLVKAGAVLEIKVIDHIIVGNDVDNYYSMRENFLVDFNIPASQVSYSDLAREKEASYRTSNRTSFRDELAEKFIKSLEEDPKNWKKGWTCIHGRPVNAVTGKAYNGVNTLMLSVVANEKKYEDNRWATFKQIKDKGWHLQAGSKGARVEYFFMFDNEIKKTVPWADWNKLSEDEKNKTFIKDGKEHRKYLLLSKDFIVFNATCIDGIPPLEIKRNNIHPNMIVEHIAEGMGVPIIEDIGGDRAYYSPKKDEVHLPELARFNSKYDYACTACHELGHATGHATRLNRDQGHGFGTEDYAKEELVAEIASCFMGEFLELPEDNGYLENHAAYVQSWASEIKDNKNYLFTAIKQAETAADYMIEHGHLHELEVEVDPIQLQEEVINNYSQRRKEMDRDFLDNYICEITWSENADLNKESKEKMVDEYKYLSPDELFNKLSYHEGFVANLYKACGITNYQDEAWDRVVAFNEAIEGTGAEEMPYGYYKTKFSIYDKSNMEKPIFTDRWDIGDGKYGASSWSPECKELKGVDMSIDNVACYYASFKHDNPELEKIFHEASKVCVQDLLTDADYARINETANLWKDFNMVARKQESYNAVEDVPVVSEEEAKASVYLNVHKNFVKVGAESKLHPGTTYNMIMLPPGTIIDDKDVSGSKFYPMDRFLFDNPMNKNLKTVRLKPDQNIKLYSNYGVELEVPADKLCVAVDTANKNYLARSRQPGKEDKTSSIEKDKSDELER